MFKAVMHQTPSTLLAGSQDKMPLSFTELSRARLIRAASAAFFLSQDGLC